MTLRLERRKNLVISAVGDSSLHRYWIPQKHSNYDLFLIYYGDGKGYPDDAKYHVYRKGSKFNLIADILDEHKDVSTYKYIWIPDDDIHLAPDEIDKLFEVAREFDLWICQPSLMGWYGLAPTLNHAHCRLRYTNYVEIMCPCFKNDVLHRCKNSFRENKSGWGIDALWNVILGHPTDRLAIVDDVIATHTRPIGGGDMYKNQLNSEKLDPAMREAAELYHKFDLCAENYEDMKNGHPVSQDLFYRLNFSIVEYGRVFKPTEIGVPTTERYWPQNETILQLCKDIRTKA